MNKTAAHNKQRNIKIKHKTVSVKNYSLEFIIWSYTENALRKISDGHWYYTQASYKHDHGLSNYRPSEPLRRLHLDDDDFMQLHETKRHKLESRSIFYYFKYKPANEYG